MKKFIHSLVIFCIVFISYPLKTYSCTCTPGSPQESYQFAQHVFVGRVITSNENLDYRIAYSNRPAFISWDVWHKYVVSNLNPIGPNVYQLDILISWKGTVKQRVVFKDIDSCSSYMFERGQKYLVYARTGYDNYFITHPCLGTVPLKNAGRDLLSLGEGRVVAVDEGEFSFYDSSYYLIIFCLFLFTLFVLLGGTALYFLMRKGYLTP